MLVVGLGRFGGGLGAARWLLEQGAAVTVTDRAPRSSLAEPAAELAALGVPLVLGGHAGIDPSVADLLVVNPAVPPGAPLVAAAERAGVPVTTEIGLLLERWPGPVLGVTGSNGKSTTVGLCGALLEAAGVPVAVGGNLGGSLLPRLAESDRATVAVLELSSFMLERLRPLGLGPDVAVITNLSPNHLDWHGSFEAYAEAKAAILVAARRAVLNASDPTVATFADRVPGELRTFGDPSDGPDLAVTAAGDLEDRGGIILPASANPLPGRMNALDLAAALLACEALAPARATLPAALAAWRPLPHRLEPVAERGGVRWVDDSVSTTPESTAASLQALGGPCVLIAGGHDKGLDPGPLVAAARDAARCVLTVGEQAGPLCERLQQAAVPAEQVNTVPAAVERAARLARPGDVVLLSPGYSSHDQFVHFEQRAAVFRAAVEGLEGGTPSLS